jgi:outer membrane usher protein
MGGARSGPIAIAVFATLAMQAPAHADEAAMHAAAAAAVPIVAASAPAPAAPRPVFYALEVNGEARGSVRLMRLPDGRFAARRADLQAWRLRVPDGVGPIDFRGEPHLPLDVFAGVRIVIDERMQQLRLEVPAAYFEPTEVETRPRAPVPAPREHAGAWLNYDLFATEGNLPGSRTRGAQIETAAFGRWGVLSSSHVYREGAGVPGSVRLDTSWTIDDLEKGLTLTMGDSIGATGLWGRAVRFGGLRLGSNFGLDPTRITFPLPGMRGESVLPTVTELYVDGVRRQVSDVPPGPFSITDVPVVTGQGELRVVTRDLLGREQVTTLNYYASPLLLRQGLDDWSLEIGRVRTNWGLDSGEYGRGVAAYQHRRGLTDTLTGELRLEAVGSQRIAGVGATTLLGQAGTLSAAVAASDAPEGGGRLGYLGFERQSRRGLSFGARGQWTTPGFVQIGLPPGRLSPQRQLSGNLGFMLAGGSLNMTLVRQDLRDQPDVRVASLSFARALRRDLTMVASVYRAGGDVRADGAALTLVVALDRAVSASATVSRADGTGDGVVQMQSQVPVGSGTSWRLLAGAGQQGRAEAGVLAQNEVATATLEVGRAGDARAARAGVSGSVATIGGHAFASRRIGDGFALIEVPGFGDVDVYVNNQPAGRTNRHGIAVVPRLLPWQSNPVRLEIDQLPLDATVDAVELDAVPWARSGTVVRFPVRRSQGALVRLVRADGTPLPVGATVRRDGDPTEFPVAERGETFMTDLPQRFRIEARWDGGACGAALSLPEPDGSLRRIGPIICDEVPR